MFYIYCGHLDVKNQPLDDVVDLLELAHQYQINELENGIEKFLLDEVNMTNVLQIYPMARLLGKAELLTRTQLMIDIHAAKFFTNENIFQLTGADLCEILRRETLQLDKTNAMEAVLRWIQINPEKSNDISACIDILQTTNYQKPIMIDSVTNQRTLEQPIESVYDMYQSVESSAHFCIVMFIGQNCRVNTIQMKLQNAGELFIDSFVDGMWQNTFEYFTFKCGISHRIILREVKTSHIKIRSSQRFQMTQFRTEYRPENLIYSEYLISPRWVVEPEFLRQPFVENGLNTKFSEKVIIKFIQPYVLKSLRLRFWDYDGRQQSFKVFVNTINYKDEQWQKILNYELPVSGWQTFYMSRLPVFSLEIKGARIAYAEMSF